MYYTIDMYFEINGGLISKTHPLVILNADISSVLNKVFHCDPIACSSCSVQGSPLIYRKK